MLGVSGVHHFRMTGRHGPPGPFQHPTERKQYIHSPFLRYTNRLCYYYKENEAPLTRLWWLAEVRTGNVLKKPSILFRRGENFHFVNRQQNIVWNERSYSCNKSPTEQLGEMLYLNYNILLMNYFKNVSLLLFMNFLRKYTFHARVSVRSWWRLCQAQALFLNLFSSIKLKYPKFVYFINAFKLNIDWHDCLKQHFQQILISEEFRLE